MNSGSFEEAVPGRYVDVTTAGAGPYKAFVPAPLPPSPLLDLARHIGALDRATRALARLDGQASLLPDIDQFLYLYVRKEALLSSQIEGTQSSLSDLLLYEDNAAPGVPLDDVEEVSNYVAALNRGLDEIRGGLPVCSRLIRNVHGVLLSGARGHNKAPGEFRRSQNWLGGSTPQNATFVPPPPEHVEDLMASLEAFIHDDALTLPILIRAALAHAQFETIHPLLDGNGRVGRLLITLMLCESGALTEPLLYLSLYFKTYRLEYYERLMRIRTHGEWDAWIDFFLQGVSETAQQAGAACAEILDMFENDRKKIASLGRAAASALRIHAYLKKKPILIASHAVTATALSAPTVRSAVRDLEKLGILEETTGKARGRVYVYSRYLEILERGTEPIRR